ncbi:MAG: RluA family pseudouridine synthase [Bacteroidales bacterium]|nr:RluA family pseudouridine synthase [Bacteroidales bacterium]
MAQRFSVPHDSSLLNCLFELFPQQSRTGVKAYLKDGRVLVNGQNRTAFDWPLKAGDTIEIISKGASIGRDMKEDAESLLGREGISVVYEDAHLIVIDKNAGVPVSATKNASGRRMKSVQSLMTDYMHTEKRANIKAGTGSYKDSSRIFLIHRIDRDASGLMLLAKDEYTKELIQSKWDELILDITFTALLEGCPEQKSGRIESWLTENPKSLKMMSSPEDDGGMRAVTRYRVTAERSRFCVAEFRLETGRRHQIRVHAAEVLGHPVAGDRKYGSAVSFGGRLALHAGSLAFRNPYGGEVLRFTSPLPAAFGLMK